MDEEKLKKFRKAGEISGKARDYGIKMIAEGVKYVEVAEAVEEFIYNHGADLAFPVNIAVNAVAAHYTPSPRDRKKFQYGDVVKLDVGAHVDGCIGDTAATVEVGSSSWRLLIDSARSALRQALSIMKPATSLGRIGAEVERVITSYGFRPIVNLTGHSIDVYKLHGGYSIPNYDNHNPLKIKKGMIIAIEPFATTGIGSVSSAGSSNIYRFLKVKPGLKPEYLQKAKKIKEARRELPFSSRWFLRSIGGDERDLRRLVLKGVLYSYPILVEEKGGIVAQWEHTVYVTDDGVEVLTGTEI